MSGCRNNKIKCNCGTRQNARCVYYDGYLPKYSKLDEDCVNIEETTEELYENQEKILDSIDLVKLGKECIDYSEFQENDSLKVKETFLTFEKEICELKNKKNENSCCIDLSKIDFKCLSDPCNNIIDSQLKLIQALIDKVCNLEQRIITLETR